MTTTTDTENQITIHSNRRLTSVQRAYLVQFMLRHFPSESVVNVKCDGTIYVDRKPVSQLSQIVSGGAHNYQPMTTAEVDSLWNEKRDEIVSAVLAKDSTRTRGELNKLAKSRGLLALQNLLAA